MKILSKIKNLLISPGALFYKTKGKRNFYKKCMQLVVNIFQSKKKKIWLQNIQLSSSICIEGKKGYLVLPPNTLLPKLSEQVTKVCNEIIKSDQKPINKNKDFLLQLLTDKDIEEHPSLLNFALSDQLLSIVSKYLGCAPLLVSMKLMKSVRVNGNKKSSQLFHCDHDDTKQVKVFFNINDVTSKNGPLTVVSADISEKYRNEHGYKWGGDSGHIPSVNAVKLTHNMEELTGPIGQIALVDTSNVFHFGSVVNQGERYLFYLQFVSVSNFIVNPLFSFLPNRFLSKMYPFLEIAKKAKITKNLYALGESR
jgi:hypothetical protein